MRILTLLLLACTFSFVCRAQSNSGAASIKGSVTDSVKNSPIGFVTISLREAGKTEILKSTYSQENGSFVISGLAPKTYELLLAFVGYAPKIVLVNGLSET